MQTTFPSNGKRISCILTPAESDALVIMVHGLNSSKESSTNMALEKIFLAHDIATLRFDLFAHGESEEGIDDRSIEKFVQNILDAITFAKAQGYGRIALCGTSFGGLSSVMAASQSGALAVLTLKCPGMGQTSRKMENYKQDFESLSWIEAGKNIRIPTLIVHGTADIDVEPELGKMLSAAIKGSELVFIEGADHRFTRKEDFDKAVDLISSFVLKHL